MSTKLTCPNCGSDDIYKTKPISAHAHATNLLPGLGEFLSYARMIPTVCSDCGLIRYFADEKACGKLKHSKKWKKMNR